MNWEEIIVTTIFTTIAGATVAFTSLYLKEKIDRKKHLKSIYGEIISNYSFLELNNEALKVFGFDADFCDFINQSYHSILISGELSELKKELQLKIHIAYSLIDDFNKERNKERIWNGDLDEFFNELKPDLEKLIKEIPKVLNFIKPKTTSSTQKKY